jgi:uncharacterized DUF497 family protein
VTKQRGSTFEWDAAKEQANVEKHGVSFSVAQYAFADTKRVILEDITHRSEQEKRYYCLGKVGDDILTVRFTYRDGHIRIFGAGYWRKGKQIYEQQNRLH